LTKDGRVPSVEVKGLKIDPSEFSTPFPGASISIPKGSIFRPFTDYNGKKGADFFLFCLPFLSVVSMVHNKRWQKRKEKNRRLQRKKSELYFSETRRPS
jgi:hypothetical protein